METTFLNKVVATDVARIELDERGFLIISLIDTGKVFDEEEAKRQIAAAYEIANGEKYRVLVDATQNTNSPTPEAKKIIADVDQKIREAIVVKSLGNRILGNIYLKFINTRYPAKIFNDKETAIQWLLEE